MRDDCTGIEGLERDEAEALITALADHIVKPAFVYRHQWRAGDLLMWDNCTVQHRAIQDYDQAVRLNPGNPDHFVSRGVAYDAKGQYDRAIQDYDQAIRLRPGFVLAFVDRGIAYANKDQYDRAIQDYDLPQRRLMHRTTVIGTVPF